MAAQSPAITIEELAEKAGLSLECLDLPFHKNHAHILAKFCDPWENIGYHLGLDINDIKEENFTAEKGKMAMLQSWKERFAYRATYRVLVQALIESGRVQKALDLCIKIKELQAASESDGASITSRDPSSEPMSPIDRDSASEDFMI